VSEGLNIEIKEKESRLNTVNNFQQTEKPKGIDALKVSNVSNEPYENNRFFSEEENILFNRTKQLEKEEAKLREELDFERTERNHCYSTFPARVPTKNYNDLFMRSFKEFTEPVSKEGNRQLLKTLAEQLKEQESKQADKSFEQVYAEYMHRYMGFMKELNVAHDQRVEKYQTVRDVKLMLHLGVGRLLSLLEAPSFESPQLFNKRGVSEEESLAASKYYEDKMRRLRNE